MNDDEIDESLCPHPEFCCLHKSLNHEVNIKPIIVWEQTTLHQILGPQIASNIDLPTLKKALLDCYGRFLINLPTTLMQDHVHLQFQMQVSILISQSSFSLGVSGSSLVVLRFLVRYLCESSQFATAPIWPTHVRKFPSSSVNSIAEISNYFPSENASQSNSRTNSSETGLITAKQFH